MALNQQAAELERLRIACRIDSSEVVAKAQEILRRMDAKCRPGSLGKGELCRTAVAFDLACRALARPVPLKTAVKICGTPEAIYAAAVGTAQRLLGAQQRYTCKEIAKAVGGARVGLMATTELKRYQERFLASYPARQVAGIDLNSTVYAVSAFYLCAKKIKHPVDKQRLLELSLVREDVFNSVCRSMLDLCYSTLGVSISDKPTAERLLQLEKNAAAALRGPGSSATTNTGPPTPVAAAPRGQTAVGGLGASGRGSLRPASGGGDGSSSDSRRRSIPLSTAVGGGAPRSHVAALARSIQANAGRKRYGGMTITPVEPGGDNEANNKLHDKTHRPADSKRPRLAVGAGASAAEGTTATAADRGRATGGAATSSSNVTTSFSPHPVSREPPAPVRNPYSAAGLRTTTMMTTTTPGSQRVDGVGRAGGDGTVPEVASRARQDGVPCASAGAAAAASGDTRREGQPPQRTGIAYGGRGSSEEEPSNGGGGGGVGGGEKSARQGFQARSSGGEGDAGVGKDHGYAEWKNRVLASMENKVKDSSRASSAIAGRGDGGGSSSEAAADSSNPAAGGADGGGGGGGAAAGVSSGRGVSSRTVTASKQASLTSFFARSSGGENSAPK